MKVIPTDSLYKWTALSGVTIFITSIYFFVSRIFAYKDNLAAYEEEINFIYSITMWGAVIGFFVALAGFCLWYQKLQKYIDIEQAARAEEQKANAEITKLKLEKEKSIE
ncbi:hypothetical protein [Endozoicomonas sp. 8E]|uniref:hypothetical protein n=1 Tax=Endozoicomonas sp. 8E TaxID=3035692 RepID=UPI002938DEED|nr:hypothetical protein [Endozoicomonas sp. 8E]WOG30143.1 hypothetical protein P6910_10955 [Endozoicomonas sp. 8E]